MAGLSTEAFKDYGRMAWGMGHGAWSMEHGAWGVVKMNERRGKRVIRGEEK